MFLSISIMYIILSLLNKFLKNNSSFTYFILTQGHFFSLLLKTKGERERDINAREKHRSVASHLHPDQGSNPQHRHVP